jgi:hypothetical protein
MAENSYPAPDYNSGALTDAEYETLAAADRSDGVIGLPSDSSVVFTDGTATRIVKIRAGKRANVRGFHWESGGSDVSLSALAANASGQTRIDRVVLRLDRGTSFHVRAAVITGTPGAGPPALTTTIGSSGVYEIPLAQITVLNGATSFASDKTLPDQYTLIPHAVACLSSMRPENPWQDMEIRESDTGKRYVWNGSAWVQLPTSDDALGLVFGHQQTGGRMYSASRAEAQIYAKSLTLAANRAYRVHGVIPLQSFANDPGLIVGMKLYNASTRLMGNNHILIGSGTQMPYEFSYVFRTGSTGATPNFRVLVAATSGSGIFDVAPGEAGIPFEFDVTDLGSVSRYETLNT